MCQWFDRNPGHDVTDKQCQPSTHGGGFVFNDIDVHDAAVRRLANRSGMAVLSVDYRRPPEHKFPAAPDDVDTVLRWLGESEWASLPLLVHGDSAGANLALVAALRHPGLFAGVALIYPFLDPTGSFDSYATAANGFGRAEAQWYWQQYAATPADRAPNRRGRTDATTSRGSRTTWT